MYFNKQRTKFLLSVACLIFLSSSMPYVQALVTPIPNQLVVKLDDSQNTDNAVSSLKQNLPNAVVMEFSSTEFNLKYWRFLSEVIWVSHGSEEGVMINGKLAEWAILEDPIKRTPNKDIPLKPMSTEHSALFTFPNPAPIDAPTRFPTD